MLCANTFIIEAITTAFGIEPEIIVTGGMEQ